MKFAQTTFTVQTKVTKDGDAIATDITLLASDVPDDVVAAALIAGNSPRVHWQTGARANGVPRKAELTWADWIGKPRRANVARPMTPEEMLAHAQSNPEFAKQLQAILAQRAQ